MEGFRGHVFFYVLLLWCFGFIRPTVFSYFPHNFSPFIVIKTTKHTSVKAIKSNQDHVLQMFPIVLCLNIFSATKYKNPTYQKGKKNRKKMNKSDIFYWQIYLKLQLIYMHSFETENSTICTKPAFIVKSLTWWLVLTSYARVPITIWISYKRY